MQSPFRCIPGRCQVLRRRRVPALVDLLLVVLIVAAPWSGVWSDEIGGSEPAPVPCSRTPPPRSDCTANLSGCLETPLGNRNSGGKHGYSICKDCQNLCKGQGRWPDTDGRGRDCRWWNY